ncbi:hypothetical protein D9757_015472 [Collybiopsis confluens]|uniref:RRM domain-containing protein n=1 Tax=Collybiopsis confluens TaxID=2823264 RepID=A0A8H5CFJ9_9AGAR|nr:hypothetical protein D9757_015472 [Collybiopsis confluens]
MPSQLHSTDSAWVQPERKRTFIRTIIMASALVPLHLVDSAFPSSFHLDTEIVTSYCNTGRSRGYVNFTTSEAIEKALEMDGHEIDGRSIKIDKSIPRDTTREKRVKMFGDQSSNPPSTTLFTENLSF